MTEILLDAVIDTLKLVPFLFVTYWFMEWLEHKTGTKTQALIRRAGRLGPLFGGMLGVFPSVWFFSSGCQSVFRRTGYSRNDCGSFYLYFG